MIAASTAVIEADGRLTTLACQPPLTLRRVHSDSPGTCALCLVGTAAGPLPGDQLDLHLVLAAGATASLQAAGASLAQGAADGRWASVRIHAELGDRAMLRADPGALIVCEGARVDVAVRLELGENAAVDWRELIVLGRTHDRPGSAVLSWDVSRAGEPLLRQRVDLADPFLARWPGVTGGHRVLASAVLAGPQLAARTVIRHPAALAQQLDEHACLVTVLGDSAARVTAELDELCRLVHDRDALPGR